MIKAAEGPNPLGSDRKTAASEGTRHPLRQQPHGGALGQGGPNRGGSGRPASIVATTFSATEMAVQVEFLRQIITGEPIVQTVVGRNRRIRLRSAAPLERIRAVEVLWALVGATVTSSRVRQPQTRSATGGQA